MAKKGKLLVDALKLPTNSMHGNLQSKLTEEQYKEFMELVAELANLPSIDRPKYTALSEHIQSVFNVYIKPSTISEYVRKAKKK